VGRRERHGKFYQTLAEELILFAGHEFRLERKLGDGGTERQHLESAQRQFAKLGIKPKQLVTTEGPPFPRELAYLWNYFAELMQGIDAGGFAAPRVTWQALRAWREETGVELDPWESRCLVALGDAYAAAHVEAAEKEAKRPT
jgi:hypothetical protein